MKHILISMAALGLLTASACKKKSTTTTTTNGCTKTWTVAKSQSSATAAITGGALKLGMTNCKTGLALTVSEAGLTGDFTAIVKFSGYLDPTGAGDYFQFVISDPTKLDSGFVTLGMGNGLISATVGKAASVVKSTTETGGTITVARTGNSITATIDCNGYIASKTYPWLAGSCTFGFQIGSNVNDLTGLLQVLIEEITITNASGTFKSDKFDCDSLK